MGSTFYIFIIHLFITFFMCGFCWFVQMVHYPLFRKIEFKSLPEYELDNVIATAYLAVPFMTVELITGIWLLTEEVNTLLVFNVILIGITALSTLIYQAPIHIQLMKKKSPDLINKLIRTNWIRTISWSIRSLLLIALFMLY